jgi:hypothetical protein
MYWDVKQIRYLTDYQYEIVFQDGNHGIVDFEEYRRKTGIFQRLNDLDYFKKAYIDQELGVLSWPDGLDIAPETLYAKATGKSFPEWMEQE